MKLTWNNCSIELVKGDLTTQHVDAVVNAANSRLSGGGGVDGEIHRRGGPAIMEETRRRYPEGCPTGSAVVSGAGNLNARFVFHAVGPVWHGGSRGEENLLAGVYRRCLELAVENDCRSVAFPAISTGVYSYPVDLAAATAIATVRDFIVQAQSIGPLNLIQFVLFSEAAFEAFATALERIKSIESSS